MSIPGGEKYQISDEKAENLEKRGFWRRAATRWLVVLDAADDEKTRESAMFRRNYCNRMAVKPGTYQEAAE